MAKLETNLLADFYLQLGLMALARDQYDLACDYFTLANEVLL